jgi:C-terminal processing protease CtpA/Prc
MSSRVHSFLLTRRRVFAALFLILLAFVSLNYSQQPPSSIDRDRAHVMLQAIKSDLKKSYYDPNFHGMDLEARFKTADEKLKQATSLGQMFGVIAQALDDLKDSHTFFVPPGRSYRTEYGGQMQMSGDKCYVIAVKPGSDAEAKGLKEGDEIKSIDGIMPTRENMWKIQYLYHALRPTPGMRLTLVKPDGKQQQLDVLAKIQQGKRLMDLTGGAGLVDLWEMILEAETEGRLHRHRYVEKGDDLFIWKMPAFDMSTPEVDGFVGKFRNRKALLLDLRGNSGGYEDNLLRLLGYFFDHDVKIGVLKRRKEEKPLIAKTRGDIFKGKLVVLIDSRSGSAAELFARVVQLEKRGTIVGDRSAGAVMRAMSLEHQVGLEVVVPYSVSVTDADVVMTDGQSLERLGVTPDELKLPAAADLAAKRDPVLAFAASLLGVTISPEQAGAMFPIEWRK